MLFLWNVDTSNKSREITLQFYDSSKCEIQEFSDKEYWPYFLSTYPLSKEEMAAVSRVQCNVEPVRKQNLFTGELQKMAKIKVWTPSFLRRLIKHFQDMWESEIDYGQGYVYDNSLVFGAPYTLRNGNFVLAKDVGRDLEQKFHVTFERERDNAPAKYAQIRRWFDLCHLPVPDVDVDLLGIKEKGEDVTEKIYLTFLLSRLANIPIPEACKSRKVSNWIKSMIYTYLRRNNILIPTSRELRRGIDTHRVPGALTLEPEEGVYFNTIVCDFESLYPSCIDSFNLSYETIDCTHKECESNKIPEVGHHVCTKHRGFYSLLIGALKDLRIRWFKPLANNTSIPEERRRLAKAASKLLKLISVSSYGVTVRIHGVACPPLAESITGYGRWALQTTWKMAKEEGMKPIYGDTDSIFLDNPKELQVQSLIKTVRERLNLDLAIDKNYTICVLPKAKKTYFGISKDGTADLKGLTAIKSNAPKFIQRVFRDCVKALSNVRDVKQYNLTKNEIAIIVQTAIDELRERRVILEELTYSVQLYYDPHERATMTTSMPQPYQCAMQLIDQGKKLRRRDIVHFVKVKPFNYKGKTFTVKPVDHIRNLAEINVEDYIRNLTTALEQIFEPMEITLEEGREMKLTEWFK